MGVVGRSSMSGTTFHARDFLPGVPSTLATPPKVDRPLHMMIASGPYCLRNGLDYTPLEQVLDHAAQHRPQVLVLLGPFLDAANQQVVSGETVLPGTTEPCSFDDIYTDHVLPTLLRGVAPLRRASPPTQVLVVPSLEEALCFHPLPQPPLDTSLCVEAGVHEQLRRIGVQFLPNPAHLLINGLRMSFTSADALSPVVRELVLKPEGKKIEEALRLLLHQQNLFPVLPREPAQVAESRAAALDFPNGALPHICAFPSAVGVASGTNVDGTLFVNPGPLCRPAALGTFAETRVVPPVAGAEAVPLRECIRVDIQKLSS